MNFELPMLKTDELVALKLRSLFEKNNYKMFRMGSFEEYELYMQNKSFLMGEDIITFTSQDGRLMALKPDVTLSIVKSTQDRQTRKLYYNESVFRRSTKNGEYQEINQIGIEYIGANGVDDEIEVLKIALDSLDIIGDSTLDISHMEFIEAMLEPFGNGENKVMALEALMSKSEHGMVFAAEKAGLNADEIERLKKLLNISDDFGKAFEVAKELGKDVESAKKPLEELEKLKNLLAKFKPNTSVRLDFSILNDADYYNGLIFQGYIEDIPEAILFGGRYDRLLKRFGKSQGAVGFALTLNDLVTLDANNEIYSDNNQTKSKDYINIALPKGRMGKKVYKMFEKAGFSCKEILDESRKLVFEDKQSMTRYFLVKPSDVDIYVEHGAADIGVVGKDILLENGANVLELLDLKIGKCRLAVAGKADFEDDFSRPLKVATTFPNVARKYYASLSRNVEIVNLHGSVELAPLIGLSDVIVDIVETGTTLIENDLAVLEDIEYSSARLIANKSSWRFMSDKIKDLTEKLGEMI